MKDNKAYKDHTRLAKIGRRLDELQAQRADTAWHNRSALPAGIAAIVGRVATELVAGVVVGAFAGWALDQFFDTSPLFLLVMFFLGAIAGMMNVWRVFTGRGMAAGYVGERKNSSNTEL